jgi:hypothetical protein
LKNLVPQPYRRVSVKAYHGEMTEVARHAHFLGRAAYRGADFVVLRQGEATTVIQITMPDRQARFTRPRSTATSHV